MTSPNIKKSCNNHIFTDLALCETLECQALGSRPLRPVIKVENQPSTFIFIIE